MDAVFLARIQFAMTIGFHFLFPPLSIGLAWLLVGIEGAGWRTKDPVWDRMAKFLARLLGLTFAMGVATGVTMEFQFGTNWASYSRYVGDIFGAPLAAEGIFAFFLESTFMGLYLFGRGRVSRGVHWFSIFMVAFGATISAFWILIANSWQQTPAGYVLQNGRAELTSFAEAVFTTSMWHRFFHVMLASMVMGAFFLAAVAAWLRLKDRAVDVASRALKVAVVAGLLSTLLLAFPSGDMHARQVARDQPEKFATFEGLFSTQKNAPLLVFGIPRTNPERVEARVEIPGLLSVLATGSPDGEVRGLESWPASDRPPLVLPFVSFHLMFVIGFGMIGLMGLGALLMLRKRLPDARWYQRLLVPAVILPILAIQLGWVAAEVGRQPWVVYHVLRTSDAASPTVTAGEILFSIVMFAAIYLLLGALYLWVLFREIGKGPDPAPVDIDTAASASGEVA